MVSPRIKPTEKLGVAEYGGRRVNRGERGYMLAVVSVFTSILLVTLTSAVVNWQKAIQREQEEELIFRGKQFMRAIELWQRKFPGTFPTTIDALLSTGNTRFLRKKWKDPLTNAFSWRLIKVGPDGSIQGLSQSKGLSPLGPSSFDSQSQGQSSLTGSRSLGSSGSSAPGSGFGGQSGSQGLSRLQSSGGSSGSSAQFQGGASQSPFSPVLGGIVGVASTSEKESLKVFNGKTKYNEWEFVYVPRGAITGGGMPQGQFQPGQGTPNQGFGGAMTPGVITTTPKTPGAGPVQ